MFDMDELKKVSGTSFLIYGESGSRKTRSLGSMPTNSTTLHLSLDYGSQSATEAMKVLGIEGAVHKVAPVEDMEQLGDWLIELHTKQAYKDNVDTIVIDNLITLQAKVAEFVSNLPRYKSDRLTAADILEDNSDKKAESKKTLPMFMDIQAIIRDFVHQLMTLKGDYNIIMLAGQGLLVDPDLVPVPTVYPLVSGPKSVKPVTAIFDNVFTTTFKEGAFDTADTVATKFRLSTHTDQLTGTTIFAKTRSIVDRHYLDANEMPADFRIVFNQIGYINKKDRPKPKE